MPNFNTSSQLKEYLDQKVLEFNKESFISLDPISIPHKFHKRADIEVSAFLTALISWGNRKILSAQLIPYYIQKVQDIHQGSFSQDYLLRSITDPIGQQFKKIKGGVDRSTSELSQISDRENLYDDRSAIGPNILRDNILDIGK